MDDLFLLFVKIYSYMMKVVNFVQLITKRASYKIIWQLFFCCIRIFCYNGCRIVYEFSSVIEILFFHLDWFVENLLIDRFNSAINIIVAVCDYVHLSGVFILPEIDYGWSSLYFIFFILVYLFLFYSVWSWFFCLSFLRILINFISSVLSGP